MSPSLQPYTKSSVISKDGTTIGCRQMGYTVDDVKRDMEVKLLLGCTSEDMHTILRYHQHGSQSALLIER